LRICSGRASAIGWALHSLESDEDSAVPSHAFGCASCRADIRDAELVMAGLAMSVRQIDPPARLRRAVLARAATIAQDGRPILRPGPADRHVVHELRRPAEAGERSGTAGGRRRGRWSVGGRRRMIAAVAVAIVGVGGLGSYTVQVRAERDMQVTQSRALADVVIELGRPGTAHATLSSSGGVPVAAVLLSGGERIVVAAGLAPNDREDTVYVVWGYTEKGPQQVGTFDVTASHVDVYSVSSTGDPRTFAGYAISLEGGRVAPASPTTVVASGPVET
jgi:hypothetical protein